MVKNKQVALFSTCLVELMRPQIGVASAKLIEAFAEVEVVLPPQSCCGQPNLNAGDINGAARLAKSWIDAFEPFDVVVVPSGSCTATIVKDYLAVFARLGEPEWQQRAEVMAAKTWELSAYLAQFSDEVAAIKTSQSSVKASYHDSCSGLRKLGIKAQPRALLQKLSWLEINEMEIAETCCGFGGAFCVKQPEISTAMADDKLNSAQASDASVVLGGDWGCLMHLQGRAENRGLQSKCQHFAEALADGLGLLSVQTGDADNG